MTGTIINTVAVLLGGCIGLLVKKGIPPRIDQAVTNMLGLATCVIGLNGLLTTMLSVDLTTGKVSSSGELMLLVCLAAGAVVGELLRIDDRLEHLGESIEKKLNASNFSKGFISASLLFCVGAMTIIGALQDGLTGDYRVLLIKSSLDCIAAVVLGASLGVGVPCAAATVLVYQGAISLLAGYLQNILVGDLLNQICMVGYAIVICIGINFFGVVKIRTANLLPALLGPVMYNVTIVLKTLWE
jgi:uncharacterized membrane protein YqgA involved in biofilm formation